MKQIGVGIIGTGWCGGVTATAGRTPEDFAAYVSAESGRWGRVARESGATID